MPANLAHIDCPRPSERPFEDRHAAIASEPRREHESIRHGHLRLLVDLDLARWPR